MTNKYLKSLISGVILTSLNTGLLAAPNYDSTYTSIKLDDCTTVATYLLGAELRCQPFRKIGVMKLGDDLRESITLRMRGVDYPLNIWYVAPYFNFLGDLIEWRHVKGKPDQLAGMIVRLNVSEDEEDAEKTTSYLVVSKVTPQATCVVGKIAPQVRENQNVKARAMAEKAAQLPCLSFSM